MKLFKNIIEVTLANMTNFGTSFIIGFILPAILSVSGYGYYREYILYLGFAYLFNFGFNDGIYIKYGGKDEDSIDQKHVNEEHNFIFVFQLIVMLIMLFYAAIRRDSVIFMFSIATFFTSMNTYHQNYLQATGKFRLFSTSQIYKSIFYILILLLGILVIKSNSHSFYISLNILSLVFLFIFFEWNLFKQHGFNKSWNLKNKGQIFKIGFFILIANMSLTFVGNVGSWVVNFGFSIEQFAQYSFQNSVLSVILLIVNSVGMVFYNVISKDGNKEILQIIKDLSLLIGISSGIAFFIFSFIIQTFLSDYIPAIEILSMTFIAIPYIMISKILIANMYKVTRSEKKYFIDSLLYGFLSLLLVGGIGFFTKSLIAIALFTSFCYFFWYIYTSRFEFPFLNGGKKEVALLSSHFIAFFTCSNFLPKNVGFMLYTIYVVIVWLIYRNQIKKIFIQYIKPRK